MVVDRFLSLDLSNFELAKQFVLILGSILKDSQHLTIGCLVSTQHRLVALGDILLHT